MARPFSVRYAAPAIAEIDVIYEYIARDNPLAAANVLDAIADAIALVREYPYKSRRTGRRSMRAVVLGQYPYIVFFKIRRGELEILHVLHAAQRHPAFQEPAFAFAR